MSKESCSPLLHCASLICAAVHLAFCFSTYSHRWLLKWGMAEMGTWQAETSRVGWSMGLTWIRYFKQRNLEKIFKYIQNHKYYEQHYHYVSFAFQQTCVCTQPHTGLSSKSLLFILCSDTVWRQHDCSVEAPDYECIAGPSSGLCWAPLSPAQLIHCAKHRPSHLEQHFSNSASDF